MIDLKDEARELAHAIQQRHRIDVAGQREIDETDTAKFILSRMEAVRKDALENAIEILQTEERSPGDFFLSDELIRGWNLCVKYVSGTIRNLIEEEE